MLLAMGTKSGHSAISAMEPAMNTAFLLMAQYDGRAVIPIDMVCRDYFPHLTPTKLVEKVRCGEIRIPVLRIEKSQKAAKGVHLQDLAEYIDKQRESARRDLDAFHR